MAVVAGVEHTLPLAELAALAGVEQALAARMLEGLMVPQV
jgi:hypothetical protein